MKDVNHTLRDIIRSYNNRNWNIPFGEKVVVLHGDFHQILLIIPKENKQEVVHVTINSSYLWNFCEVLTLDTNTRLIYGSYESNIKQRNVFFRWILGLGDESND